MRAYYWKDSVDAECGLAIVAKNIKNAKKLGYEYWASEVGVEPETWIEQRVKWMKDANIEGIEEERVVEGLEGLRRGIYGWMEEEKCDGCGYFRTLYHHEGKALCNDCIEKVAEDE